MKFYKDYKTIAKKFHAPIQKNDCIETVSFTPYIYNQCNANCRFCSEHLTRNGNAMICDTICPDYLQKLKNALNMLADKKVFLSISGKEPSESPEILQIISNAISGYSNITEKVMYSNLSGFCKSNYLTNILCQIGITRIECSRHHYDENINQSIMHFKPNEKIRYNHIFSNTVSKLAENFPVRMVCVFQKSGISHYAQMKDYLSFAKSLGINDVVFRELAVFDKSVDNSKTADYIFKNRIDLSDILQQLHENEFRLQNIIQGYYYYSFEYTFDKMKVCFEMSDYEEMERKISQNHLHKLILYPNGKLCMNWNMLNEVK